MVSGPQGGTVTLKRHHKRHRKAYPFMVSNHPQFPEGKLKRDRGEVVLKFATLIFYYGLVIANSAGQKISVD